MGVCGVGGWRVGKWVGGCGGGGVENVSLSWRRVFKPVSRHDANLSFHDANIVDFGYEVVGMPPVTTHFYLFYLDNWWVLMSLGVSLSLYKGCAKKYDWSWRVGNILSFSRTVETFQGVTQFCLFNEMMRAFVDCKEKLPYLDQLWWPRHHVTTCQRRIVTFR